MHTRPATTPNYRDLPDEDFASRVTELQRRYADCDRCAYDCRVDRTAGEIGACNVDDTAYVSAYFDHHGVEDVRRCPRRVERERHGAGRNRQEFGSR